RGWGIVKDVRAGIGVVVRATGRGLRAIVTLGGPTSGQLHVASWIEGERRSGSVDVGLAGKILVVGSRIDAETLTRARAMGVRGIIVAGLASQERRDFLASENRQRAALHRLPPFAVLVLEGAVRRPLAGPVMDILEALEGHDVALVADARCSSLQSDGSPHPSRCWSSRSPSSRSRRRSRTESGSGPGN